MWQNAALVCTWHCHAFILYPTGVCRSWRFVRKWWIEGAA